MYQNNDNALVYFTPLYTDSKMRTLASSEDPDEMPYNSAFHQGLYGLLRKNPSSEKYTFYMEIITCDPSVYTMDHPKFVVSNQKKQDQTLLWTCIASAHLQRVNNHYAKFEYKGMKSV